MTTQTLTINIEPSTLGALQASGFQLYAFRPVTSSNKSGVPLVWGNLNTLLETNSFAFASDTLTAYVSVDAIAADTAIAIGANCPTASGQIVGVADDGNLTTATGAPPGDVYITSAASIRYTCGLASALNDTPVIPFCAFALYPQATVTMQPANAIFVMWATSTYDPAVYMRTSLGTGLLVAFGTDAQRTVSYDINQGWQTGGAAWATLVVAGTDLASTLIFNPGHNHPLM